MALKKSFLVAIIVVAGLSQVAVAIEEQKPMQNKAQKPVIYQIFTRLFGNSKTTNKPWGTIEENGVGKFNDINDAALESIQKLGVTHVWYTGVLQHAVIRDYTAYGISNDDPDVVKGRAGSPYAVKDYYNVDPDLAKDPAHRLQEYQALIARTHKHGLKVIMDIVPNHVARQYHSTNKPQGQQDLGADDDKSVTYKMNNNFYYVVGENFKLPVFPDGYKPLGGEAHPLSDGKFKEEPAKWTGNGTRKAQPAADDWYETVKLNYGVRPDGTKDFPRLPESYANKSVSEHAEFWRDKQVPDTWKKMRAITEFWLEMGVDGFRFDMAEMVPVEFWSYLNSNLKSKNPQFMLVAEVYNPAEYRNYIKLGKMDFLYDKVEMYDSLKAIIQGKGSTDAIANIQNNMADIESHMLHFLENHDEQRIASPEFAGDARKAKPAMVISATISSSPTMIYFGQEVGEPGAGDAGFGHASRTSIFDYWGVPNHQRWLNNGRYDGGSLTPDEKSLRDFYARLLNISAFNPALAGKYQELHSLNRAHTKGYGDQQFAFARWGNIEGQSGIEKLIIVANFSPLTDATFDLKIPAELVQAWTLKDGHYQCADLLAGKTKPVILVKNGSATLPLRVKPLESFILQVN